MTCSGAWQTWSTTPAWSFRFFIAARMRAIRAALELPIEQIATSDARRIEFNALHGYSVNALGIAMIAALVALIVVGRSVRQ